ncbi:MAG: hypothetical protein GC154_13960 [bacterium]|nr:hypothetical protein [bacterium]
MFTQTWRDFWGLQEDPFTCEDADKDGILSDLKPTAVHWSFDRLYGSPRIPAPAIIFGEKGSGKSALRLMMRRRLEQHNQENPDNRVFLIEYIDYNPYMSQFRRAIGVRNDDHAADKVIQRWGIAEHLDCILSLGVSQLVDQIVDGKKNASGLSKKLKVYLILLAAMYYNSNQRTQIETVETLMKQFGLGKFRVFLCWASAAVASFAGLVLMLLPWLPLSFSAPGPKWLWLALGGLVLAGTWLPFAWFTMTAASMAARADRAVKALPKNTAALREVLNRLTPKERKEYNLPRGSDESPRYQLLQRFTEILKEFGYEGVYIVMDRIDEPTLISAREDAMRAFVEKLLDIKLLQFPNVGLKLFLPIELDKIHRNAPPEQLKRMRLDKSNLIPELKWSGQELYEIANQRLQSSIKTGSKAVALSDFFAEDFDIGYLKETLNTLGTPRYAFGFLSEMFSDYVKTLPNELSENDPRWNIPRSQFDIVRNSWIDRSGVLRRVLN